MIKRIKKYLTSNELIKNMFIMVSGTTIAQLLPILLSPILTRLYTPEDFGILATFTSITIIFIILANGKYDMAIILARKDSYGINILFLTFILSFIVSLLLFITILLFHDKIVILFKAPQLSGWIYLIPVVVFFLAGRTALAYFLMRFKKFKLISKINIARSVSVPSTQMGLFFANNGLLALITGYSFGQFVGYIGMLKFALKDKKLLKTLSLKKMRVLAKQYKEFPLVQMPSAAIGRISREMPNLMFTPIFGAEILGLFSLGFRILSVPSALIGTSISQVFMQAINEEFQKKKKILTLFKSTLKKILVISIPTFVLIGVFSTFLFGFIFGHQWDDAGVYVQILSPMFLIRFITVSLTSVLYVLEKHKIIFLLQSSMLILSLLIFGIAFILKIEIINFLWLYSFSFSIYYLIYFYFIWRSVKKIS